MRRCFITIIVIMLAGWNWLGFPVTTSAVSEKKRSSLEKLEKELKTGMEYKRILVLERLAHIATPDAYGLIIQTMLHDKSKPVRRAAQRMLEGVSDPRIAESIIAGLEDENRKVRIAAIDVAGLVREPEMACRLLQTAQAYPHDTELVRLVLEALREMVYRLEPPEKFEMMLHPFIKHRNKKVRQTAVIILAILGRPASLPYLLDLWEQSNTKMKIHLADAFANIGRIEPVELLQAALVQKNTTLILHSLYALAQIQSFSSLDQIYHLLRKSHDPRIRMACLYALIEIPDPDSIPVILEIFETQDPTTLHWAIYALSQLQAKSAAAQLINKLSHPASLVRASAAMALGELKIAEAEDALLQIIADENEETEVRVAAAKALIKIGNPQGAAVLWKELQRPNLNLEARLTYALALGTISDEKVRREAAQDLESPVFTKSFTAALMLGISGDNRGKALLVTALEHGYPLIRRYAILGLESIQDKESLRALADTANDDRDTVVRILCAASLVRAGFDEFRVILWNALDTRNEDIRSEAIIALGRSADAKTIRQLKWYLRREPSIPVRQTIQRVLREWKER